MTRRVALINNGKQYAGPALAREFAARDHDIVLAMPADGLVAELEALGATVEVVDGKIDISNAGDAQRLVDAGIARFGRIDTAVMFSGQIIIGRFLNSTIDQLHNIVHTCLDAPYEFLKAVVPPMVNQGDGQVLVITSAAGARPTPGAPLYSSVRAGATMMTKNVADEVASTGVQVNACGTNFMDFPEFRKAAGADDPERRAFIESQVPMGRLGTMEEFAAFCMTFLDGTSRFTTGQYISYAGGWA
ncbi:MAG: SDR family oxidoreductase [Actinomycetes bacterium]